MGDIQNEFIWIQANTLIGFIKWVRCSLDFIINQISKMDMDYEGIAIISMI